MVPKVVGNKTLVPVWYKELLSLGPFSARVLNSNLPLLLKLSFDGHCPRYSTTDKWHLVIDGQVVWPPAPRKSKVLILLGNSNDFSVPQSGHQQLRISFVHSEQRSVGEDVSNSSPRQRVVTFMSPRTLRRSSAQTARLDAFGSHPRCSGPNGIESLQSQRRICRPELSMVTPL